MPFLVLPETAQVSAAFAILSPFSNLARTRASEVLTVVSRLVASMGASFRHHTCLLCGGSRAECEQSYGSFGPSWITFRSARFWALQASTCRRRPSMSPRPERDERAPSHLMA